MHRQRILLLIGVVCLLLVLSFGLIYRRQQFNQNHFRSGDIPSNIINELMPKSIPIDAIRPPAIRASDPVRYGSVTSVISIIEYGDFECEYCRQTTPELERMAAEYKGRVRFVWRDFPLDEQHPNALDAAIFARCAGQQGKYWDAHDLLMRASIIREKTYQDIAAQIDLDAQRLSMCRKDPSIAAALKKDIEETRADGIQSVPFTFIGTKGFEGVTNIETLRQTLQTFIATP